MKFAGAEIPGRVRKSCDVTNSLDVDIERCVDVNRSKQWIRTLGCDRI
jgi:hypothetical protein